SVGNIETACGVRAQGLGKGECGIGGRTTVAVIGIVAIPRDGSDDAVGVHLANAIVFTVSDVQAAGGVQSYVIGIEEVGVSRCAPVARIAGCAIASDRGDDTTGVHLPYSIVPGISDIQVAGVVQDCTAGIIKTGVGGGAAVAARTPARHGTDDVVWEIGAVELPLVGEWSGPIQGHAQPGIRSRQHRLAGWLARNRGRQLERQNGDPTRYTAVSVADYNRVFASAVNADVRHHE